MENWEEELEMFDKINGGEKKKKLGWVERRDKMEKVFPELLEACKQAWSLIHSYGPKPESSTETIVKNALEKAIAKAEDKS